MYNDPNRGAQGASPRPNASIAINAAEGAYHDRRRPEHTTNTIIVGPDKDKCILIRFLRRDGIDQAECNDRSVDELESRYTGMLSKNKLSSVMLVMAADAKSDDYMRLMSLLNKLAPRKKFGLQFMMSPCSFAELSDALVARGVDSDRKDSK